MGDLNREQLADITAQRFQENVARKNRQTSKQIDSINTASKAQDSKITSVESRVTALENSVENYRDITFTLNTGSSTTVGHSLGVTPTRWVIIDQSASAGVWGSLNRTAWSSSNISFYLGSGLGSPSAISFKVRVYE